jgi:adenine-specific DNA methylase
MKSPKKLIEVALPLEAINRVCAHEKSIWRGHPSTLHLWWARWSPASITRREGGAETAKGSKEKA